MWEFCKENWGKIFLCIGIGSVIIGCGITLLWPEFWKCGSFALLLGTVFVGIGFYLKSKSKNNLSDYGHFMLGLATLITLPQAPEMLKHLLDIEKAAQRIELVTNTTLDLLKTQEQEGSKTIEKTKAQYPNADSEKLKDKIKEKQIEIVKKYANKGDPKNLPPGTIYMEGAMELLKKLESPNTTFDPSKIMQSVAPPTEDYNPSKIEEQIQNRLQIKRFDDKK